MLYEQLSPYSTTTVWGDMATRILRQMVTTRVRNPSYPEEDYETFVVRAIARKKRRVEMELDIEDIPVPDTP